MASNDSVAGMVATGVFAHVGELLGTGLSPQEVIDAIVQLPPYFSADVISEAITLQAGAQNAAAGLESYFAGEGGVPSVIPVVPGFPSGYTLDVILGLTNSGVPGLDRWFGRINIADISDIDAIIRAAEVQLFGEIKANYPDFDINDVTLGLSIRAIFSGE